MKSRTLAVKSNGKIRTAVFEDREHIVVPLVAIVEGVLHASNADGPELVLAEEFGKSTQAWDGRPAMLNHPSSSEGMRISANNPSVLDAHCFGRVFNTRVLGDKLLMDAFLDPMKAEKIGPEAIRALTRVRAGELVEVSVGAFISTEDVSGTWKDGKRFNAIWRDIVPDHLAILPEGTKGACSVEAGCGAPRAAGGPGSGPNPGDGKGKDKEVPLSKVKAKEAAKVFVELHNTASKEYKKAFAEVGARMWHDDDAHLLKSINEQAISNNSVGKTSEEILSNFNIPRPLTILDSFPKARIHQKELDKKIDEIHDRFTKAWVSALKKIVEARSTQGGKMLSEVKEKFLALMERFTSADEPNSQSDTELRSALDKALLAEEPGFLGVVSVFAEDSQVVYAVAPEGTQMFFRRAYSVNSDGVISLKAKREEVKQVTKFEAASGSCGCGEQIPAAAKEEKMVEVSKEKKDRVAAVVARIAAKSKLFVASDAAMIEQWSDDRITALEAQAAELEKPVPVSVPVLDTKVEEKKTAEQEEQEYLSKAPAAVREAVAWHKSETEKKRNNLVDRLKTHQKVYSEGDLRAMAMPDLEKLALAILPKAAAGTTELARDFSGAGVPRTAEENNPPPPISISDRIKANRTKAS